ncbi:DUF2802 domain-containing protein [Gallaecimonas sp. GXIMD4217]|uniref:DUF2802 domain-containing protein n=1 Tax=Gallaecimonas sp. GXIMD4217 TaxID=3131927 RepID=UPI00311AC6C1
MTWLLLALIFGLIALFGVMSRRQQQLQQQLDDLKSRLDAQQGQLNEVHSGAIGMGERLLAMAGEVEHLKGAQDELVHHDPQSKLYSRAAKMVALGADVDELMRECELPRAEAELLYNLHRPGKA